MKAGKDEANGLGWAVGHLCLSSLAQAVEDGIRIWGGVGVAD